jgi:hypothetical protein
VVVFVPVPVPVPEEAAVTAFDHERLDVYRSAIDALGLADETTKPQEAGTGTGTGTAPRGRGTQ